MEYKSTPHNSKRLILYRDEMPKNNTSYTVMLACLDAFSIWGGFDGNNEEFLSWEFQNEFPYAELKTALSRIGCTFRKNTEPC